MRKFCLFSLLLVGMLMLTSCQKKVESMFGMIPSIYENEMMNVTKEAQSRAQSSGEILSIMTQLADSAFNVANEKSQDEVNKLKGALVEYTIDIDLDLAISSDIKIEDVNMPVLSRSDDGMVGIKVSFDVKTTQPMLLYILEGDEGEIGYGSFEMPSGTNNGEKQHIEMNIKSPNVPAIHQQNCKTIRFVSDSTLNKELFNIQPRQIEWKKEYKEQMKL